MAAIAPTAKGVGRDGACRDEKTQPSRASRSPGTRFSRPLSASTVAALHAADPARDRSWLLARCLLLLNGQGSIFVALFPPPKRARRTARGRNSSCCASRRPGDRLPLFKSANSPSPAGRHLPLGYGIFHPPPLRWNCLTPARI